jgi:predicted alpha/beta hydrolase family esterase
MSKQVLFIQGGGAGVHDEWDNKLVESLARELGPTYEISYPCMPDEADPTYAAWKTALEQEIAAIDDGAILIGHSIGGTILINALAENPPDRKLSGVFLIAAPFVGAAGWSSEDIESSPELGARLPAATPIYLYHGSADDTAPFAHIDLYARAIPYAFVRRLEGRNHQLDNDLAEVAVDVHAFAGFVAIQHGEHQDHHARRFLRHRK